MSAALQPTRRIALVGTHLPRRCGIATFTSALGDALLQTRPDADCFVVAVTDEGHQYAYPRRVRFELTAADRSSYRRAADFLNVNNIDVVSLQHEYGIYGGRAGSHVLALLRELRSPIVSTLHTVLERPTLPQRAVLEEVLRLSQRVVVMSETAAQFLRTIYRAPPEKIAQIPHGIPGLLEESGYKVRVGLEGRPLLLTFGLLSPDKGIEYVLDALPAILERHPEAVYVVLGATHPKIKEEQGESYRASLAERAHRLGVSASVRFLDRFVEQKELEDYLGAADLYLTPYLQAEQITSGTLAFAVGAGKAVVSTPYWYAAELLAHGRGRLVPYRDAHAIAREVLQLLGNDRERRALGQKAAGASSLKRWPAVAEQYLELFDEVRQTYRGTRREGLGVHAQGGIPDPFPTLELQHLRTLCDDIGVLQHASYNVPRYREGYCLDDNARGLLLTALLEDGVRENGGRGAVRRLASRFLAFVDHAFDGETGRFRNFMSFERRWSERVGSEDSHGRALWALGTVVGRSHDPGRQGLANELFGRALPAASGFTSPRAWAFTLLGIHEYLEAFQGDSRVQQVRAALSERLLLCYQRTRGPGWEWFEDSVTYENARLPHALLVTGARLGREDMVTAGLRSLAWLEEVQRSESGNFSPIGSNGFYRRGGARAEFDQQPLEACAMISACLEASAHQRDPAWLQRAGRAFRWFLGDNHLHTPLFDPSTGGCRDGLHEERVNENQGAESTLAFLLSLVAIRAEEHSQVRGVKLGACP